MQLLFEHTQQIGPGRYPAAYHSPANICQVFYVNAAGRLHGMTTIPEEGAWATRTFGASSILAPDKQVEYFKTLYIPGVNLYGVWHCDARKEHRLGVLQWVADVSEYLVSGSLEFNLGKPVVRLSLELENPDQIIVGETDNSIVALGARVHLFFRAGDSARYSLGQYIIDRCAMSVTDGTAKLEARNLTGKLLSEQTFNTDNVYTFKAFEVLLADLLTAAGVTKRDIYDSANQIGMRFPPSMTFLEGIDILMDAVSDGTLGGWTLREKMDGTIVLGPLDWSGHDQPGSYIFERGTEVVSRDVTRDDAEVYTMVCVYTATDQVYRTVEGAFTLPSKKTLHVEVPAGTTRSDLDKQADALALRIRNVGIVETFVGPFRPHLQVGDEAIITDGDAQLLGHITTVTHEFGRGGFWTTFVVDSGGVIGAAQVRDYINKMSGQKTQPRDVTRLY